MDCRVILARMAATTLVEYEALRDKVEDAIEAILEGAQSVSCNGRTVTRANLGELQALHRFYNDKISRLSKGTRRVAEI